MYVRLGLPRLLSEKVIPRVCIDALSRAHASREIASAVFCVTPLYVFPLRGVLFGCDYAPLSFENARKEREEICKVVSFRAAAGSRPLRGSARALKWDAGGDLALFQGSLKLRKNDGTKGRMDRSGCRIYFAA